MNMLRMILILFISVIVSTSVIWADDFSFEPVQHYLYSEVAVSSEWVPDVSDVGPIIDEITEPPTGYFSQSTQAEAELADGTAWATCLSHQTTTISNGLCIGHMGSSLSKVNAVEEWLHCAYANSYSVLTIPLNLTAPVHLDFNGSYDIYSCPGIATTRVSIYVKNTQTGEVCFSVDEISQGQGEHDFSCDLVLPDRYVIEIRTDAYSHCYLELQSANCEVNYDYECRITHSHSQLNQISTELSCNPSSGTLPFNSRIDVTINNESLNQVRQIAGRIDVTLADGQFFPSYRAGYTNVDPSGSFVSSWLQRIPALTSLVGNNTLVLHVEDVTPAPYNQPPYAISGDTAIDYCTVTGIAP